MIVVEINDILVVFQINNCVQVVIGVFVFNKGVFGQVFEGFMEVVEDVFDSIQVDQCYVDVIVFDIFWIDSWFFLNWLMGFVGFDFDFEKYFSDIGDMIVFDLVKLDIERVFVVFVDLV